MLVIKTSGVSSRPNLPVLRRDPILDGDNNGIRFLFDAAFKYSYAGGNPTANTPIRDVSEHENSRFVLANGQTVTYQGGGFDFSALTVPGSYVEIPAAVGADLRAEQQMLVALYVKLPARSDWLTAENSSRPILTWRTSLTTDPEIVSIQTSRAASRDYIQARRRNSSGGLDTINLPMDTAWYGSVVQVGYYRKGTNQSLVVTGAGAPMFQVSIASGPNAVEDWSAVTGKFGVGPYGGAIGVGGNPHRMRIYRALIENLQRSGRDPLTVLADDYANTMARGVFS